MHNCRQRRCCPYLGSDAHLHISLPLQAPIDETFYPSYKKLTTQKTLGSVLQMRYHQGTEEVDMPNIVLANDHGAVELAARFADHLKKNGYTVNHLGVHSPDSVDYPDMANLAC